MPTAAVRTVLFVSAYAPLLVLFALLDSLGAGWPSVACASTAAASVVALALMWRRVMRLPQTVLDLAESRPRDTDVIGFLASYVVPFAAAQDADADTRAALLVFVVVLAGLYLRTDLFYVNPLLALAGWRVFEATTDTGRPVLLLTRRRFLRQRTTVRAAQISGYVHVEPP